MTAFAQPIATGRGDRTPCTMDAGHGESIRSIDFGEGIVLVVVAQGAAFQLSDSANRRIPVGDRNSRGRYDEYADGHIVMESAPHLFTEHERRIARETHERAAQELEQQLLEGPTDESCLQLGLAA